MLTSHGPAINVLALRRRSSCYHHVLSHSRALPAKPERRRCQFTLWLLFGITTLAAVFLAVLFAYGIIQAAGATIGLYLVCSSRWRPLGIIVLLLTVLSTRTPFQYVRRHADEIVAAGCKLIDQCPPTSQMISLDRDYARVPPEIRNIGLMHVWVDNATVTVSGGAFWPQSLTIYRVPQKVPPPSSRRENHGPALVVRG